MCPQYSEIDSDPYVSLPVAKLVIGSSLPFEVFVKDRSIVIPLFNQGARVDGYALNMLHGKGIETVYVKKADQGVLEQYLSLSKEAKKTAPDPETFNRYITDKQRYYLIDRSLLRPGTNISFNLYVLNDFRMSVLLPATDQEPAAVEKWIFETPGDVMIDPDDIPRFHAYLSALLSTLGAATKEREQLQHVAIRENSKLLLKDLLADPRSGEKIKQSIDLVNIMVDSILESKEALGNLLSLRTHDYYTYTHSVNVAVLSVGLGMAAGLNKEEVRRLGIGAMLHDVGKSTVPAAIINKAGRLTEEELLVMKGHVTEGEKILRMHKDIPEESFVVVSQHHERLSGKGYPNHRAGTDVHLYGRIASIVDCYDAMTTERSYQTAHTPFYSLSYMAKESGDYDAEVLRAFIRMLGQLKT